MDNAKLLHNLDTKKALSSAQSWFADRGWKMFKFQRACLNYFFEGKDGLLNAPTGMGKTFALSLPFLLKHKQLNQNKKGLKVLWVTPLRALSVDIRNAIQEAVDDLDMQWKVERRSGDVSSAKKKQQLRNAPDVLVTTPESIHLLLATKGYAKFFSQLDLVVVDEWHELLSSKRGVQVELGLSRLRSICPEMKVWGVSATVGNMAEAKRVLFGTEERSNKAVMVRSERKRKMQIHTILPQRIDEFPWAGHLGIRLLKKTLPIIKENKSTILFTNTRSQAEIWYNRLIDECPELIGEIAMHHGSLDKELRAWVERALHEGQLKAVVSTSSLDLGVDFRPVSAVVQIGSPKGIARFVQRAGRSGHSPYATSKVYFLPTNSLEIIEAMALKRAVKAGEMERRKPVIRSFDLLSQYMMTLAVSDGFDADQLFEEIKGTHAYATVSREEFERLIDYISTGGKSLQAYEEFNKVEYIEGLYRIVDRKIALRHRLSMGTIVGDIAMTVCYQNGKKIGSIEEYFISRLSIGDAFRFAGQTFELMKVEGFRAIVRPSASQKAIIPSWQGGRMSLSSEVSEVLRQEIDLLRREGRSREYKKIKPLLDIQVHLSSLPAIDELLIEEFRDQEGHHLFIYPFEGRMVHEGLAMLIAYRLSQHKSMSLSLAMNDYGFEILCDQEIPLIEALEMDLFSEEGLLSDITASSNMSEMARRKFRNIAAIAGLTFRGYPGKLKKERHLQSSSSLFFDVFADYESDNLLLQQAYEEVLFNELEADRMRRALQRINRQRVQLVTLERISPLAFPIMVDRLRDGMSNESIEQRVARMLEELKNA